MGRVYKLFEPASPKQRVVISRLCMALRVKEPLEDGPISIGEAGRLIREMGEELTLRRRIRK